MHLKKLVSGLVFVVAMLGAGSFPARALAHCGGDHADGAAAPCASCPHAAEMGASHGGDANCPHAADMKCPHADEKGCAHAGDGGCPHAEHMGCPHAGDCPHAAEGKCPCSGPHGTGPCSGKCGHHMEGHGPCGCGMCGESRGPVVRPRH